MSVALVLATAATAPAQTASPRPFGRVSFMVDTVSRGADGRSTRRDSELSTAVTFRLPESDGSGAEFGVELRQSRRFPVDRPARLSIYDAFVGARVGNRNQLRLRAGHMWLSDLGTTGALAGGLVEVRHGSARGAHVRAGAFMGLEPNVYDMGYAPGVRKQGGYVAVESGYLRRHVIGYTQVRQGSLQERSVVAVTNFVPAGTKFFAYQVGEFDVTGPANGTAARGLSYFLANVRVTPAPRLELLGTYNQGHSLDARTMTADLLNGRPLTPQAIDGLRYESRGGRATVEVARNVRIYGGYSSDRNNRDDAPTGRVMVGAHAGNLFGSRFDVSASDSRINRPDAPYHSQYLSVGRGIGRGAYLSVDYSTSLSVVRFQRSDGLVIETRPSTRRLSANGSVTLSRSLSLLCTVDVERDTGMSELRLLSGLSYRLR